MSQFNYDPTQDPNYNGGYGAANIFQNQAAYLAAVGGDPSQAGQGAQQAPAQAPAAGGVSYPGMSPYASAVLNPQNYLGGAEGSAAGVDASGAAGLAPGVGVDVSVPGAVANTNYGSPGGPGGPAAVAAPTAPSMSYGSQSPSQVPQWMAASAAGQAQAGQQQRQQAQQADVNQLEGEYNYAAGTQIPSAYGQMVGLAGQNQAYNQAMNQQRENQAVGQTTQRAMAMGLGNAATLPGLQQAARQPYAANQANISANAAQQKLAVLSQQENAIMNLRQQQRGMQYGVAMGGGGYGGGRGYYNAAMGGGGYY